MLVLDEGLLFPATLANTPLILSLKLSGLAQQLADVQQFPAWDFRPENTLVLISHFANSLCIMLSRIPYLTTWANGVARHGTCSR